MIQATGRLDNEAWVKRLFHEDQDLYVSKMFEMVTPAALVAKTSQLRAQKQLPVLHKRYRQDPATSTMTFAKTFGWAAQVLGLPVPELYVREDVPGVLAAVPSTPPASLAGQVLLAPGFPPQLLAFILGKHLAGYRGEHYIKYLFPARNDLKVILFAGVKLVMPELAVPIAMSAAVDATAPELARYIQPVQRESLRIVVQRWVAEGAKADVERWMRATEITACRAGLLLCGDLEAAKTIVHAEPQLPGAPTPDEKMNELLRFSRSEHYAALRGSLGGSTG
jgi:hypothetical protein